MKIRFACFFLAAVLPLSTIGCGKKEASRSQAEPEPTAVVDPSTAGTITGTVKLDGPLPVFRPIDMSAEATCQQAHPTPAIPAIVIRSANGALANVVVYVKSGLGSYHFDVPASPVTLAQKGCMYDPRVLAVRTGQTLDIDNEDPTIHNVHPMPRVNHPWNKSEPVGDPPIQTSFPKPELAIPIACNIHPWMRAFLFVFADPYFDITSKSGTFELKNLPPGTYTIETWQEKYGFQDQIVTLGEKESKAISFTYNTAPSR